VIVDFNGKFTKFFVKSKEKRKLFLNFASNFLDNMNERFEFTTEERGETLRLYTWLKEAIGSSLHEGDEQNIRTHIASLMEQQQLQRDVFGLNPILSGFQTAQILVEETGVKRDAVLAILLHYSVESGLLTLDDVEQQYGASVSRILHGLRRIQELYKKNPVIESENFRNLLLSFAEDMRVILIMIADRVNLMRQIRDTDNLDAQTQVSQEAAYLYAPLAHKLGLYKLKSELEDL
jgi:GTP pyrophosphokinase